MNNLFVVALMHGDCHIVEFELMQRACDGRSIFDPRSLREGGYLLAGQRSLDGDILTPMMNSLVGDAKVGEWSKVSVDCYEFWTESKETAESVAENVMKTRQVRVPCRCCCSHVVQI
ncbi:MAG: hypothetical protein WC551_05880 [Patescibacteria group bacterium]